MAGGLYDQSPCVPAVGTFHSGTVCEPASWVRLYDQQAAASCEELAEPRLRFEALAHHVQDSIPAPQQAMLRRRG